MKIACKTDFHSFSVSIKMTQATDQSRFLSSPLCDVRRCRRNNQLIIGVAAVTVTASVGIWIATTGILHRGLVLESSKALIATTSSGESVSHGFTLHNESKATPFFTVLPWEERSDGQFIGVLEFCSDGNVTFGYGLLGECTPGQPSPLIRMKPKQHYQLTLVNNAHIDTNLHTHGLHVSGVGASLEGFALSLLTDLTLLFAFCDRERR
jgi:hypothetical protein